MTQLPLTAHPRTITLQRILDAATELSIEEAFQGTRMVAVSTMTGQPALLHQFDASGVQSTQDLGLQGFPTWLTVGPHHLYALARRPEESRSHLRAIDLETLDDAWVTDWGPWDDDESGSGHGSIGRMVHQDGGLWVFQVWNDGTDMAIRVIKFSTADGSHEWNHVLGKAGTLSAHANATAVDGGGFSYVHRPNTDLVWRISPSGVIEWQDEFDRDGPLHLAVGNGHLYLAWAFMENVRVRWYDPVTREEEGTFLRGTRNGILSLRAANDHVYLITRTPDIPRTVVFEKVTLGGSLEWQHVFEYADPELDESYPQTMHIVDGYVLTNMTNNTDGATAALWNDDDGSQAWLEEDLRGTGDGSVAETRIAGASFDRLVIHSAAPNFTKAADGEATWLGPDIEFVRTGGEVLALRGPGGALLRQPLDLPDVPVVKLSDLAVDLNRGATDDQYWTEHAAEVGLGAWPEGTQASLLSGDPGDGEDERYYYVGTEHVPWVEGDDLRSDVSKEDDHLYLFAVHDGGTSRATWVTDDPIDLTNIDALMVDWEALQLFMGQEGNGSCSFVIHPDKMGRHSEFTRRIFHGGLGSFPRRSEALDVSDLSGSYYVRVHAQDGDQPEAPAEVKVYGVFSLAGADNELTGYSRVPNTWSDEGAERHLGEFEFSGVDPTQTIRRVGFHDGPLLLGSAPVTETEVEDSTDMFPVESSVVRFAQRTVWPY